ncbi:DUF92 domain-containing protein [Thermoflexus sp.]|uniref:DUF92 domain-containing protein n=2 Tax=Thermoflexus sp. TaxID=1969742 RepID=UPI0026323EB2|nr:DUF92 domain-containing protein [Thermoflexus sp.]MCX7691020.1 DUF92 domain-containing protein [Thermoflexus sp.]MDW8185580.1 DUF92 domain-containing protein [Anaerolineae bacterium]
MIENGPMVERLILGLALSALIGGIAFRLGALTGSGWLGAVLVGTSIFGFGGWPWAMLLIAFFVSASALTRYGAGRKAEAALDFAKGGRRDLAQALANGGVGAALAILWGFLPHPALWWMFAGSLAAVTADTWATEVGLLSGRPPWHPLKRRPVPPGTSGALTLEGTIAAALGALGIGILAVGWSPVGGSLPMALAVGMVGFLGMLLDSFLGATVQRIYWCARCGKETERPIHRCGQTTQPLRGWRWLNNDVVNALAALLGALGMLAWSWVMG